MTNHLRSCLFTRYFWSPKKVLLCIKSIWFIQPNKYTHTHTRPKSEEGNLTETATIQVLTAFRDVKILTLTTISRRLSLQAREIKKGYSISRR